MRVTADTRRILAFRRERRAMRAAGFSDFTDWRMARGCLWSAKIVDAKVSQDGSRVYYRIEGDPAPRSVEG